MNALKLYLQEQLRHRLGYNFVANNPKYVLEYLELRIRVEYRHRLASKHKGKVLKCFQYFSVLQLCQHLFDGFYRLDYYQHTKQYFVSLHPLQERQCYTLHFVCINYNIVLRYHLFVLDDILIALFLFSLLYVLLRFFVKGEQQFVEHRRVFEANFLIKPIHRFLYQLFCLAKVSLTIDFFYIIIVVGFYLDISNLAR